MKKQFTRSALQVTLAAAAVGGLLAWSGQHNTLEASSHREAPLIAEDPLADNTDLYAFRSPDSPANDGNATVTIVANYIPFELPQGGPNFNTFGENIRYEIHVKNNAATTGDDITYRFTFTRSFEDPSTFFRVRLGKINSRTTYKLEQSLAGGAFTTLIAAGDVPVPNIGPRSISGAAGLNQPDYAAYAASKIQTVNGMKVFCGPSDDAFFTDLGGIFDLGGIRSKTAARDGLARKNVHSIVMQIPVTALAKAGTAALTATTDMFAGTPASGTTAASPVSPYTIGVWASASRPAIRTFNPANGTQAYTTGTVVAPTTGVTGSPDGWVQISRIGMPLTNEVVQAVGLKDEWNAGSPYGQVAKFDAGAKNPELGLYMADNTPVNGAAAKPAGQTYYGEAVPGFAPLRIQTKSLAGLLPAPLNGGFDFRDGAAGLSPLYSNAAGANAGTAFAPAPAGFGEYLLNSGQAGNPRSVDLLPIFHTGVPNLIPYQLATGKTGNNPLTAGKPFINNFLPTFGDMLRLNMAVPPTDRASADFSSEGLLAAAVLGLTDTRYTASGATAMLIPNMDGFPNGRRLEDDVTRIELQAVGGVVLAAVGLWYDDFNAAATPAASPVTQQLKNVLGFTTNVEKNDTTFRAAFPYVQTPWSGTTAQRIALAQLAPSQNLGLAPNLTVASAYPNPSSGSTTFRFELATASNLNVQIRDVTGRLVATVAAKNYPAGINEIKWQPNASIVPGQYIASVYAGKTLIQSLRVERR
ncbi:DUF4331 family protein [Hymenobacter sp. BRD128]|uniref:DUF4331 family protein n=1 Tax=Hymenobacter sp. BRD128 TaxID=2675878 RepID=UPI00156484D7|nr:DUF4331 family protein [Hymenobacter sp. BRD128]QKG56920.1 DUF4331 family protein [Hymenobacter sp. BRD128]